MPELQTTDKQTQALLLVLSIEEEAVSRVLQHLSPDEIRTLHELANSETKPNRDTLISACQNFMSDCNQPLLFPGEGQAYIEKLTKGFLGRDESKYLFEGEMNHPLSRIEKHNAESVATIMEEENPHIIAAVLAKLTPAYASSVIELFDKNLQVQVLAKIARLGEIPGNTIDTLCHAVEDQLSSIASDAAVTVDGVGRTASILQRLPLSETEEVLSRVGEADPELANKLRRAMFSFEDLIDVVGRGIQSLIKEVSNNQLLLALKTASDPLKDKMLSSVSKRAAEILLDDMMAMGPVKLSEVEQAQQEIVDTALRLEAESKIVIGGRGGEELV